VWTYDSLFPLTSTRARQARAACIGEGVPGKYIPACASCHDPEAKGDGAFPRLAGQLHDYIFRKLVNWSKERGQDPENPDTSAIMEPIAHSLDESQVAAVAAYLSNLN
jgi:cytochrome c553